MAFTSIHFLLFFPVVLALAWSLRRHATARLVFLLIASYYFYMSWNVLYAGLILGSTVLDFFLGRALHAARSPRSRRALLIASLTGNLGVLALFKYYNFFADSLQNVFGWMGADLTVAHHSLLLPVGISFYTFQTLSYTIDIYRRKIEPTPSFLKFALFVSFFPQLVAGPIVRASHFLPQLDTTPAYDDRQASSGLGQMIWGVFQKVCIADILGVTLVDPVYASPGGYSSATLLLVMYAWAFQIYFDFSGYSNIAIGAARMMGYHLPINFNRPYVATSLRDFWRRWHISLSSWLRDYLYIPLGGGRGSALSVARNLALVMLLGGLWHGAAWGMVLWGAAHGLLLGAGRIFHRYTGIDADRDDQPKVTRLARVVVTFHLAAGCFVLFRAPTLSILTDYVSTLAAFAPGRNHVPTLGLAALALAACIEWTPRSIPAYVERVYQRLPAFFQAGVVTACLLLFAAASGTGTPFIYFQF